MEAPCRAVTSMLPRTLATARGTVRGFVSGTDDLDLCPIDANESLAGDQAFTYIGNSAFSGYAGELNGGVVSGDVNGDGAADFQINVTNVSERFVTLQGPLGITRVPLSRKQCHQCPSHRRGERWRCIHCGPCSPARAPKPGARLREETLVVRGLVSSS